MGTRRDLVTGLKETPAIDPEVERRFVYGEKARGVAKAPAATIGKAPISTRIRADLAQSLKRASLERQLEGIHPHTLQEILEEAIEPWLRSNGYMPPLA